MCWRYSWMCWESFTLFFTIAFSCLLHGQLAVPFLFSLSRLSFLKVTEWYLCRDMSYLVLISFVFLCVCSAADILHLLYRNKRCHRSRFIFASFTLSNEVGIYSYPHHAQEKSPPLTLTRGTPVRDENEREKKGNLDKRIIIRISLYTVDCCREKKGHGADRLADRHKRSPSYSINGKLLIASSDDDDALSSQPVDRGEPTISLTLVS